MLTALCVYTCTHGLSIHVWGMSHAHYLLAEHFIQFRYTDPSSHLLQYPFGHQSMASVAMSNRVLYMNKFLWCEECGVPKERVRFEVYDLGYDICQECVSRLYGGDGGGGDASGGDGSGAGTTGGGGASGSATTGHSSERRGPRVRKCVQKKPAAGPRVRSS